MVEEVAKVKKKLGRPRMNAEERLVYVSARMRPGDVEKLVEAAHRRGIPTGSVLRDSINAFLVLLEHPGTVTRAGLEDLRVQLGYDQVAGGGRRAEPRQRPASTVPTVEGRSRGHGRR